MESAGTAPYQNGKLPVEERIRDLLGRMTLREKARQLDQYMGTAFVNRTHPEMKDIVMADDAEIVWEKVEEASGTEGIGCIHDLYGSAEINNQLQRYAVERTRLGIPILFSEEALHGLMRPGCTIFPHAIAQACSWDPEVAKEIGRCIAAETRSFGICETFGPVLDLAREPRWGRVEETYGEDTHLAARMAAAMVRGLQDGGLASASAIAAEPKHFAVYGVPEGGLNVSPCSIGTNEMLAYYLPVFEAAFVEGGAPNAMCSYNSIDGIPCAANPFLLTEVLRNRWKMPGFVRADLGAIIRLKNAHRTAQNDDDAIRQALEAGTDMQYYDFPHPVYQDSIVSQAQNGSIAMETLDRAVSGVLRVKFMLGLFDRPYTETGLSRKAVRCGRHVETALKTARKCICLLKNDKNLLPLRKNIRRIAVLGPGADAPVLGGYTPAIIRGNVVTLLDGIRDTASKDTEITCVRGASFRPDELEPIPAACLEDGCGGQGLKAEFYDNPDLTGRPAVTRTDTTIHFNWAFAKPDDGIGASSFSVRWSGFLIPDRSFSGCIGVRSEDSVRLFIDGLAVVDAWAEKKGGRKCADFRFEAGKRYAVTAEYRKDENGAVVLLGWFDQTGEMEEAVQAAKSADVAIVALGDGNGTCGEWFDRMDLSLLPNQRDLLKAVYETGTPVVLVLQNGRPVSLGWESERIPAILEAWYAGEQGGKAIAEALFGDCNPAGRLPISFPKSVGQLPVYYSRRRGGSGRYVEGIDNQALYPFGHGLSYTTFRYEDIRVSPATIGKDGRTAVTFSVTNTGKTGGEEVAQLYLCDVVSSVVRPEKELRAFKRFYLDAGEKADISFELSSRDLRLLDRDLHWVVEPGKFRVMVGGSSDNIALTEEFEVE